MEPKQIEEALTEVSIGVLQQLAFAFPVPGDESTFNAAIDDDLIGAVVHFKGSETGSVSLAIPLTLARELHDSVLGDDTPGENQEVYIDSVKELANVVTGNLLSRLYGDDIRFELSPPEFEKMTEEELAVRSIDWQLTYLLIDDLPMLAAAQIEKKD